MLICPFDCHWCDWSACRTEGCRMASEPGILSVCGVRRVDHGTRATGQMPECVAVALPARAKPH